ncbi:hypothetical protein [Amycolatopsis sp. H20-H5]|uniref:hypothetical protein n=1 Tax=Amycolatopsis sp. H20-H5 TaxID=3046309 RepID=UPI002DB8BE82|nr:hypothetical protein [Amycolatopsis sp. H20-H5]MEC3977962.1 hypothetical protein [Amycolatopsis sp. H20-H5]
MAVDSLPRPAEWPPHSGARFLPAVVILSLFGLGALVAGFGFVGIGKPGGLKYGLLFALFFLLIAAYGYYTRVRRPNGEVGTTGVGTQVRYSGFAFVCLVGLMCCLTAIFLLAAVDYRLGGTIGAAIVFGLIGLMLLSFPALVVAGRIKRGSVILSAQGVHQRGWTFSSFLPWEAFAGVKAVHNGRPEVLVIAYANVVWEKRQLVRFWKIDKVPPAAMIEVDCAAMSVAPEVVYWLLKFYVENPGARAELGTDAAIARVRAADLAP